MIIALRTSTSVSILISEKFFTLHYERSNKRDFLLMNYRALVSVGALGAAAPTDFQKD